MIYCSVLEASIPPPEDNFAANAINPFISYYVNLYLLLLSLCEYFSYLLLSSQKIGARVEN